MGTSTPMTARAIIKGILDQYKRTPSTVDGAEVGLAVALREVLDRLERVERNQATEPDPQP